VDRQRPARANLRGLFQPAELPADRQRGDAQSVHARGSDQPAKEQIPLLARLLAYYRGIDAYGSFNQAVHPLHSSHRHESGSTFLKAASMRAARASGVEIAE
jgi:hypothetical protein